MRATSKGEIDFDRISAARRLAEGKVQDMTFVGRKRSLSREQAGEGGRPSLGEDTKKTERTSLLKIRAYAPVSFSSAALLRIRRVEPRSCANCFSRNSPSTRVTVSREVPMSCAISSCVKAILIRIPSLVS